MSDVTCRDVLQMCSGHIGIWTQRCEWDELIFSTHIVLASTNTIIESVLDAKLHLHAQNRPKGKSTDRHDFYHWISEVSCQFSCDPIHSRRFQVFLSRWIMGRSSAFFPPILWHPNGTLLWWHPVRPISGRGKNWTLKLGSPARHDDWYDNIDILWLWYLYSIWKDNDAWYPIRMLCIY